MVARTNSPHFHNQCLRPKNFCPTLQKVYGWRLGSNCAHSVLKPSDRVAGYVPSSLHSVGISASFSCVVAPKLTLTGFNDIETSKLLGKGDGCPVRDPVALRKSIPLNQPAGGVSILTSSKFLLKWLSMSGSIPLRFPAQAPTAHGIISQD